nr:MAG TPA: hypothetical protein [Bacteriophage sp.]
MSPFHFLHIFLFLLSDLSIAQNIRFCYNII